MDIHDIPTRDIPLTDIVPSHEVRDAAKLEAIRRSMKARGWDGRPLLVVAKPPQERATDGRVDGKSAQLFLALTGSHRLAAAELAGREHVPCYIANMGDVMYVHQTRHGDWLYGRDRDDRIEQEEMERYFREVDPLAARLLAWEKAANAREKDE